jgi:hypothetical protein
VLDGEEDHLLQLLLGLFQTTDVLPLDVGHFDVGLTQRRRVDSTHRELEVLLGHAHRFEDLGVDLLGLDVDDVHLLPDALQGRFSAEGSNVRSHETVGVLGNGL